MNQWTKTNEKLVYDGYRKIVRRRFKLPNGKIADFDIAKSKDGVAILALTDEGKIICFEQFRPGPERVLFELPGGAIDENEEPIKAMNRELMEETGYEATITYIGSYYRDAYIDGRWHMYVGKNAKKTSAQKLGSNEFGELKLFTVDEFKQKLFAGLMTDTTLGYAGLKYLGLL